MRLGPGGVPRAPTGRVGHRDQRQLPRDDSGPGRPQVEDVQEGDLWYFPAGLPHSLQGLDPDGTEFVLAFDNGESSEFNTLLVTDWIAHTLPEVLVKNFGLPVEASKNIPLHNRWIYQSNRPAPPLETGEAQMAAAAGKPPYPFVFRLADLPHSRETKGGTVRGLPTAATSSCRRRSRPHGLR
jgi:oxalate decarboxylase